MFHASGEGGAKRDGKIGLPAGLLIALGSVRGRLTLLVVALIIIGGLVSVLVAVDDYRDGRRAIEAHLGATANAMSIAVDGKIQSGVTAITALASSPALQAGDLAALDAQARRAVPNPDRWVMLADDRGRLLLNTALPRGAALPPLPPTLFQDAVRNMGRGNLWISDRVFPNVKGRIGVGVAFRVRLDGRPAYLGIGMDTDVPQDILTQHGLTSDSYALLLDRDGAVIAHTGREPPLGREAAAELAGRLRRVPGRGLAPGLTFGGRSVLAAYRRSPFTGWTLIVGEPMADVRASLVRSLVLIVAAVTGLLALGVFLAFRLSRGVGEAVELLSRAAESLGEGVYEGAARTGLSETDGVARAIRGVSVRLSAREQEVRRLNETLEARVAERTHELAVANERLVEAKKLEAVGRVAGGVAHDFNNLLTVIMGCFDLLDKRLTDASQKKLVAGGREAALRGATLTRRLLAFGRRQRLEPEPLDLNAFVEDTAALISGALGPNVSLRTEPAPGPVWANADRQQLQEAMMNLASNARDAMADEGGEVTIATGRATVQEQTSLQAPPPGDYSVLSVRDTGPGMTPEIAALMWEPFAGDKGQGVGSGLGLPQVLGMAQQLGGGVGVETGGRGTCVSVYLPPAETAAPAAGVAKPASVDLADCKVLLVDDDADVRRMTAAVLTAIGCRPEEASSGPDALAHLEKNAPDIVVTDYAMPGMTGAELARRLATLRPDLPVLMISGYMDAEALERSWSGPLLTKPFDRQALARRLSETLAGVR
jgi:signal transduction histidine kinase/DNA-binding NarL/FixJ family response regulator